MSPMPFSQSEREFNQQVGRLVKHWRVLRGHSQEGLAALTQTQRLALTQFVRAMRNGEGAAHG